MFVQQYWSFPRALLLSRTQSTTNSISERVTRRRRRRNSNSNSNSNSSFLCLKSKCMINNGGLDDVAADIIHNRVLIAAALSGAIGQLLKPFTSSLLYRNDFDFKAAFQPGGFPSTHSSAVVATATSLGLERGFSDSIFGLAVVYAALIMYDAQGVRREVGTHAKTINSVLLKRQVNSVSSMKMGTDQSESFSRNPSINMQRGEPVFLNQEDGFQREEKKDSLLTETNPELVSNNTPPSPLGGYSHHHRPLKETVGHTEIEVIAGALLGFFVSLAVSVI